MSKWLKNFLFICCLLSVKFSTQDRKCGRPLGSNFTLQSDRIVSGYDLGYYRYPWYAALIQEKQVACGGALIGSKLVLTAAHCYKEYLNSGVKLENIYTVRLGVYNICTTEKTVTDYKVDKVQVHELYASKQPYYDICLLTLHNSADRYEPVCLPNSVISKRPKEGSVPGMGTLKFQGAMPCTLQEARLLIYPDSTCTKMINTTGNDGSSLENAFCAGYMTGGIDTCQGDSGGPLQITNEDGRYVIFGIVSFGFQCAMPGYLGIYTDASKYVNWIKEKSGSSNIQFINSQSDEESSEEVTSSASGHKKKRKYFIGAPPIRIIILGKRKSNNRRTRIKNRHKKHH